MRCLAAVVCMFNWWEFALVLLSGAQAPCLVGCLPKKKAGPKTGRHPGLSGSLGLSPTVVQLSRYCL